MKKIFYILICAVLFAACESDRSSNPVLSTPQDFTLNTPSYANLPLDLTATDSMTITWTQPQYTRDYAPLLLSYEVQVSLTNKFVISLDSADGDMTHTTMPDYAALPRTTTLCSYNIIAEDLNYYIMRLGNWEKESDMPQALKVYLRVNAFIQENLVRLNEHASNSISLNHVVARYEKMEYRDPILWYMVGDSIGNHSWGNDGAKGDDNIGEGLVPMFYKAGERYDRVKGTGVLTYTGLFFKGQQFRFLLVPGEWNDDHANQEPGYKQLITPEGNSEAYRNLLSEGGDNNIRIEQDGCYIITANTATKTILIDTYMFTVPKYTGLSTTDGVTLDPVFTLGHPENHLWKRLVKGGDTFKVQAAEGAVWGYKAGLVGSTDAAGNIVIPEGRWLFFFNDITADYMLIKK